MVRSGNPRLGAAAKADLKEGDVVTAIDGKPARQLDPDQLERRFEDGAPGSRVSLTVSRDGKPETLIVKLADIL